MHRCRSRARSTGDANSDSRLAAQVYVTWLSLALAAAAFVASLIAPLQ